MEVLTVLSAGWTSLAGTLGSLCGRLEAVLEGAPELRIRTCFLRSSLGGFLVGGRVAWCCAGMVQLFWDCSSS